MRQMKEKLQKDFWGDIANDEKTLSEYSHDTSIFSMRPSMVVYPKNTEDIKNLINFVKSERSLGNQLSLKERAAGTDMTDGPLTESIVVDCMRYFNHIKEVGANYAITEPGVFYRDFEKATLKKNLIFPSYPASREIAAMGGIVANNAAGEKTLTYGKTEKYVQEIKMVLQDGNEYAFHKISLGELEQKKQLQTFEGEIYRKLHDLIEKNYEIIQNAKPTVSKNSAGYALWNVLDKNAGTFDISKLIVGSQGTFGIITEAKISLVRPKTHSRMLIMFIKDMNMVGDLVKTILQFQPESFESYDDHTFHLALKFFPLIVKRLKGNIISLGLKFLPELWAVLTNGIPKLVLMAEFTAETDEEALATAQKAEKAARAYQIKTRVTKNPGEAEKYWVIRRESFNLLRQKTKNLQTAPFIDDMVVHPYDFPEFLPQLYKLLDSYNITYTIAGHVGNGNFHIIPLMDLKNPESKKIIRELSEKAYELVFEFKGSITGEHNDGLIRTPFIAHMFGDEVYRLFQETKRIFDPDNIFNPGKKVGTTFEYAMQHIAAK